MTLKVATITTFNPDTDRGRTRAAMAQIKSLYADWRRELGVAADIARDMAMEEVTLRGAARRYHLRLENARSHLIRALSRWIELRTLIDREVAPIIA